MIWGTLECLGCKKPQVHSDAPIIPPWPTNKRTREPSAQICIMENDTPAAYYARAINTPKGKDVFGYVSTVAKPYVANRYVVSPTHPTSGCFSAHPFGKNKIPPIWSVPVYYCFIWATILDALSKICLCFCTRKCNLGGVRAADSAILVTHLWYRRTATLIQWWYVGG